MKTLKLIFLTMLLLGCGGVSKETRERWAREKDQREALEKENSEKFVKAFVEEFWTKPIKAVLHNWLCDSYYKPCGLNTLKTKLAVENTVFLYEAKRKCHSPDYVENPPIAIFGESKPDKGRGRMTSFKFGYPYMSKRDPRNANRDYQKRCHLPRSLSDLTSLGNKYRDYEFYTPSVSANELKEMLIAGGVPLHFCFELEHAEPTSYKTIQCSLQKGFNFFDNGISYNEPTPGLEIVVSNNKLISFELKGLYFSDGDLNRTPEEVFNERFQDEDYVKEVHQYLTRMMAFNARRVKGRKASIENQNREADAMLAKWERESSQRRMRAFTGALKENAAFFGPSGTHNSYAKTSKINPKKKSTSQIVLSSHKSKKTKQFRTKKKSSLPQIQNCKDRGYKRNPLEFPDESLYCANNYYAKPKSSCSTLKKNFIVTSRARDYCYKKIINPGKGFKVAYKISQSSCQCGANSGGQPSCTLVYSIECSRERYTSTKSGVSK